MSKCCHGIRRKGTVSEQDMNWSWSENGHETLSIEELIEQCRLAYKELIDVTCEAAIQTVLRLLVLEAIELSPLHGARRLCDPAFYGHRPGRVFLSDPNGTSRCRACAAKRRRARKSNLRRMARRTTTNKWARRYSASCYMLRSREAGRP